MTEKKIVEINCAHITEHSYNKIMKNAMIFFRGTSVYAKDGRIRIVLNKEKEAIAIKEVYDLCSDLSIDKSLAYIVIMVLRDKGLVDEIILTPDVDISEDVPVYEDMENTIVMEEVDGIFVYKDYIVCNERTSDVNVAVVSVDDNICNAVMTIFETVKIDGNNGRECEIPLEYDEYRQ